MKRCLKILLMTMLAGALAMAQNGQVQVGNYPAANLTGTTLPSNIVSSSLTRVGTLTSLAVSGAGSFGSISGGTLTGTGLTVGNCVQVTTGGLLTTTASSCGTSSGTITDTGSPVSGNLAFFSGATSITNGNLSGDATTSGTNALTLATVNTNTGSFGSSTAIPVFTVNGKGLITAASTNAVVAPAGTLTGTTLASNVVTSSLTSVGTLGSLAVTGVASAGSYAVGTLGYTATNALATFQNSVNGFTQVVAQNTNAGAAASADFIVNDNLSTDTTYYGDFGMNSSTFSGTGSLALPNAVYLYAQTGDLVLGTGTANAIHFVVNSGASDSATVSTAGAWTFNSAPVLTPLTGYLYGNGASAVTGSTTIPASAITGLSNTSTATIAVGAGAGSGGTAACVSSTTCTAARGRVTITAGSVPTTGTVATATFGTSYASAPVCQVTMNGGTTFFIPGWSSTTGVLTLTTGVAITALGTAELDYFCTL